MERIKTTDSRFMFKGRDELINRPWRTPEEMEPKTTQSESKASGKQWEPFNKLIAQLIYSLILNRLTVIPSTHIMRNPFIGKDGHDYHSFESLQAANREYKRRYYS